MHDCTVWGRSRRSDYFLDFSESRIFLGDPVIFLFPCFDIQGLKNTRWCGRNQVIVRPSVTFYLDGAHTPRSVEVCLGKRNAAFAHITVF